MNSNEIPTSIGVCLHGLYLLSEKRKHNELSEDEFQQQKELLLKRIEEIADQTDFSGYFESMKHDTISLVMSDVSEEKSVFPVGEFEEEYKENK